MQEIEKIISPGESICTMCFTVTLAHTARGSAQMPPHMSMTRKLLTRTSKPQSMARSNAGELYSRCAASDKAVSDVEIVALVIRSLWSARLTQQRMHDL